MAVKIYGNVTVTRNVHKSVRTRKGKCKGAQTRIRHQTSTPKRSPLPSIHQDWMFWKRITTLPKHLLRILSSDCNLWAYSTTRPMLMTIIRHFNPGHRIRQCILKEDLIKMFGELVAEKYGLFYGI